MGNSTRYYQLTNNILLEYVYSNSDTSVAGDAGDRVIDLQTGNRLYSMDNGYDGKLYLFCRDGEDDNMSGHNYGNLVVSMNGSDSKFVKVRNERTGVKYDDVYGDTLVTREADFSGNSDSRDMFFDTCIIHFTGSNYFGDYDSLVFQATVNDIHGYRISLASILFTRTDDVVLNDKPLLINQRLYTTHISFRIPSVNYLLTRDGRDTLKYVPNFERFLPNPETGYAGEPTRLQKNTPVSFSVFGVKSAYYTGGFTFLNTESLNTISVPNFDSYKKVSIVIEPASDGDYFRIYAQVNKGGDDVMSFSDYIYSLDAHPSEYIIMHEVTLFESYADIYNKERTVKTHSEYHIVNLSANEDDNEIDDVIKYRPVCIHANRDFAFTIEDTLRIINTADNTTVVKKSYRTFTQSDGEVSKYGKRIGRIFNDEPPLKVNVYNKRMDEDLDRVQISKSGKGSASIENHQYYISSFVECTNIGVSIQQVSKSDVGQ